MIPSTQDRTVAVERDLPHPPAKVWRALTQPHLAAEWLMPGDVGAAPGHRFRFEADWGAIDCRVLVSQPERHLSWSWTGAGIDTVVTFTLTPTASGTHLRLEQTGFQQGQGRAFAGARAGWTRFLGRLDGALAAVQP